MTNGQRKRLRVYHVKKRFGERFGLLVSGQLVRELDPSQGDLVLTTDRGGKVHSIKILGKNVFVVFNGTEAITVFTEQMKERFFMSDNIFSYKEQKDI